MALSSNSSLALSSLLSVLAMRLEAKCRLPGGWPADARDDELFANYVAVYALCTAGRRETAQIGAAVDKLLSLRLESGLWRGAHAEVEPTARAAVALQWAESPPSTDLRSAIRHIRAAQLADGGWALQGTDVVVNPHGEIGPSLPCTLALHQAQARSADKATAASLARARGFFQTQLDTLAGEVGKDAKADLAYAWAVRGLAIASLGTPLPEVDQHRACLEQVVQRVLDQRAPPDDVGFQLLFNALHSLALLIDKQMGPSAFDIEEATSCVLSWALIRDARGAAPTRWLAGALLAGATLMARRHRGASLFVPAVGPNLTPEAAEVDVSPAESFVAALWHDWMRRPAGAQVRIAASTIAAVAAATSAVFGLGLNFAPRLDEPSRKVAARLAGDLEVMVADKTTGRPVPGARLEMRPVAPGRIVAVAGADGKARLNWNLVDPESSAIRMEIAAQPNAGGPGGRTILPDKPGPFVTVYVP